MMINSYTPIGKTEWGRFALKVGLYAINYYAVCILIILILILILIILYLEVFPSSLSSQETGSPSHS